jgi:hypothetical protein
MSLFKLGERRAPRSAWQMKEHAVASGIFAAHRQILEAATDDERRQAEQKLRRFEFTAERLKQERAHTLALAEALMVET